jgi:MYXO-CTERM domain-containing protein
VIAGLAATAQAGPFQTVTINFDDQPGGIAPPVVTDGQFSPHASFSTEAGHVMLIFSGAGFVGGSVPNVLTAAESVTAENFDSDIYVDFTVAAQNLTLDILADNDRGVVAALRVVHGGGVSMVDVIGNANLTDRIAMDLSGFADVSRVELIDITDEFGLAIDNLQFDVPVPTPGVLATIGLAGLAGLRRRRA